MGFLTKMRESEMPLRTPPEHFMNWNDIFSTTSEKIGGIVSAAMISSPWWMTMIKPYSDIAALLAPILGCIYLSLQIGFKLLDRKGDK
jgi:hypothetical protein